MADYHPLIARAVYGLEKNTGENRRALYERARSALVNQLRSVEPALEESDITRERLALEEAIRKVEADAVKRMRSEPVETPEAAPTLSDQGLRGFRETVADAEGLGDAAAQANRAAHEVYEAMPGEPARPPIEGAPPPAEHYFEPPPADAAPEQHGGTRPAASRRAAARAAAAAAAALRGSRGRLYAASALLWPRDPLHRAAAGARRSCRRRLSAARPDHAAGGEISHPVDDGVAPAPASKPKEAAAPVTKPKIADRIGPASGAPAPANAPAAAVAQKVVLYDEDPNDPKGKRYVGSAFWRTETVSPGPGLAPELAIRADVEIPERHMRMTWSLRRNTDKALPASHTIEIMFTLGADFPEGGIANVPGVLMKQDEQARGVPLAGLAVKVTNGYFLIGLSAVDIDVAAQHPIAQGTRLVRHSDRLYQRQARHPGDGEGHARRARLRGSVPRVGGVAVSTLPAKRGGIKQKWPGSFPAI